MSARDLILHNLPLKALSFVLAGALWLAIHSNLKPSESAGAQIRPPENGAFTRPIYVMTSPEDRQSYSIEPSAVSVKVKGDSEVLKKLNPDDIQVFVRLTYIPVVPSVRFPVEVKLPANVALEQVSPSNVKVEPVKSQ